jgi:hypothetical protein
MLSATACKKDSTTQENKILLLPTQIALFEEVDIECKSGIPLDLVKIVSSDKEILDIKDGKLIAKKIGQVNITATLDDLSQTSEILVVENISEPTIHIEDFGLILGDSVLIEPKISYKGRVLEGINLQLSSTDTSVVALESGNKVKGLKNGTSELNVIATFNGLEISKKTVTVTVNDNVGIYPSKTNFQLTAMESAREVKFPNREEFSAKVYENGVVKEKPDINWTINDNSVAILDGKMAVKGVAIGKTTLCGTYTTETGKTITTEIVVNVDNAILEMHDDVIVDKGKEKTQLNANKLFGFDSTILKVVNENNGKEVAVDNGAMKTASFEKTGEYSYLVYCAEKPLVCKVNIVVADYVVYEIKDLKTVADHTQEYVVLANDLQNIGEYTASSEVSFVGTFNGLGHTLDGMSMTNATGLFKQIDRATVKNVAFTNLVLSRDSGALFYKTFTSNVLENIYVKVKKMTNSLNGAICDLLAGTTSVLEMKNCIIVMEDFYNSSVNYDKTTNGAILARCGGTIVPTNTYVISNGQISGTHVNVYNVQYEQANRLPIIYSSVTEFKEANLDLSGYNHYWDLSGDIPVL